MDRAALIAEAKRRRLLAQVKAARDQAKPAPTPEPDGPGLLARSRDRLALGLSDVLSTVTGNTYGRDGDPTQRDSMAPSAVVMKAAGGDVIPAVGSVIADAAMTAGKAVLPESAENAIASAAQTVAQSAPVQAVGKGLQRWKAADPNSYAAAGELANVAGVLAPVPKPALTTGAKATQRLARSLARKRKTETLAMLTPDNPLDEGSLQIADDVARSKKFVPSPRYEAVIDEVASIPGVNPRKSYTANMNALESHVTDLRKGLDDKLVGATPIPGPVVEHAVGQAVAKSAQSPMLVGDAGKAAERIYAKFDELVQAKMANGEITPQGLLDTRRELDAWLKSSPGDVFGPGTAASKIATREIRRSINTLVDKAAPGAGVSDDLARMNKALEARDLISSRAVDEAQTGLGRYMATLERSTGLKHPVNPQSAYITATNPVVGVATGAAALALGLRRGLGESFGKFNARMENLLQEAINRGAPAAERAAIIAAMNQEKEKRHAAR